MPNRTGELPLLKNKAESTIPDKMFFKIGEVGDIAGVETHVLRFWESEFKQLKPTKNRKGQRVYQKKDIETVLNIKKLLYEKGYTIAGAKKWLKENSLQTKKDDKESITPKKREALLAIKKDLKDVLLMLKKKV